MAEPNARELKLIQYLNEAYGTEKQLEIALQAHIQMATRSSYRKRLQQHLTETKRHGREVERRIKQLGGKAETVPVPVAAEAAQRVQSMAGRALAAAQGPLHALRGTGEAEKQLKNAKTEFASEAEEIATYTAIEALAVAVGDRDTERLAKAIRREEERMAGFLERLIPQLTKAVATAEIPRALRDGGTRRRRSTRRSTSSRARSRATPRSRSSRSRSSSGRARSRSTSARSRPRARSRS
jgi:ferritin-like metal-binding protein YciE